MKFLTGPEAETGVSREADGPVQAGGDAALMMMISGEKVPAAAAGKTAGKTGS